MLREEKRKGGELWKGGGEGGNKKKKKDIYDIFSEHVEIFVSGRLRNNNTQYSKIFEITACREPRKHGVHRDKNGRDLKKKKEREHKMCEKKMAVENVLTERELKGFN